jgi:hypothetical protein
MLWITSEKSLPSWLKQLGAVAGLSEAMGAQTAETLVTLHHSACFDQTYPRPNRTTGLSRSATSS